MTHEEMMGLIIQLSCAADYLELIYDEDKFENRAAKRYSDDLRKQVEVLMRYAITKE